MRLSRVLNEVIEGRKRLLREARRDGDLEGAQALLPVNNADVLRATGLSRSFLDHLRQGGGMTLREYAGAVQWLLSECESEADRLDILLLIDTVLFCAPPDSPSFPHPVFSKPLPELLDAMLRRETSRFFELGKEAGRYGAL